MKYSPKLNRKNYEECFEFRVFGIFSHSACRDVPGYVSSSLVLVLVLAHSSFSTFYISAFLWCFSSTCTSSKSPARALPVVKLDVLSLALCDYILLVVFTYCRGKIGDYCYYFIATSTEFDKRHVMERIHTE